MTAAPDPEAPERRAPEPGWQAFVAGVRSFVARRVPAADAEDVAQEVFVRLHQGADSLRDASRAQAWVFSIARRTVVDYYRARRPPGSTAPFDEAEAPDAEPAARRRPSPASPGAVEVHEEVLSWLRPMAESLPSPYREALLRSDFDGDTQQRIADDEGLSLSGAKSRVQRARLMLAERLRDCCQLEFDGTGRVIEYRARDCDRC